MSDWRGLGRGGPFAYDLGLYRLHSGSIVDTADLPKGFYFIFFIGHTPGNESMANFMWTIERY
jgi:hypothetical protein